MYELPYELPNILRLRKLGNYKKIPEIPGFDDKYPADHKISARFYLPVCEFKHNIKNFRDIDCGCLICQT